MKKVLLSLLFAVIVMSGAMAQKSRPVITTDTTACGHFTWEINGQTYTQDTVDTYVTTDTIYVLQLTISANVNTTDSAVTAECSFTWNDSTYLTAGTITATLKAADGCDSIVTRELTLTKVHNQVLPSTTSCSPFIWYNDTITVTPTSPLTHSVHDSVTNCDSNYTMELTIVETYSRTDSVVHCGDYMWYDSLFTASTVYSFTDTTGRAAGNCDSLLTLDLTISYNYDTTQHTACEKYKWNVSNITYTESGTYQDSVAGDNNCTTVKVLELTIIAVGHVYDTIVKEGCDVVGGWNGDEFRNDTTVTKLTKFRTINQCYDSTTVAKITVNKKSIVTNSIQACDSYYWEKTNEYYSVSTTVYDTCRKCAANGCDSLQQLNITINQSPKILSIDGNLIVDINGSTTLTAQCDNENLSYYWKVSGSNQVSMEPSITISNITENTDVTLDITDNSTYCENHSWVTIICGLGIEENEGANISIYPNPTSAKLNVETSDNISEAAIFNTLGQQVSLQQNLGSKGIIDLSNISKGTYTLRLTLANGNTVVRKFIVNK